MKKLPTQKLRDVDYADMVKQLQSIFYRILFLPLNQVIETFTVQDKWLTSLTNAGESTLVDAINKGRIQYENGVFSGEFSAAISGALRSIGAKFDKRQHVYTLDAGRVPGWVKGAASNHQAKAKLSHDMLKDKLSEIQRDLNKAVEVYVVEPERVIANVEKGFQRVGRELQVMPYLSAHSQEQLSAEYTNNMKIWIKKFSEEQIVSLRELVEKNATQGYRFDKLIGSIKGRYAVTTSKSKFLARQETALFMSKYRKDRFGEAGVTKYQWSTSHDSRVRHDHKHLDQRIFSYNNPPIVDTATGRKANPGEDFNCRCVDIPILTEMFEAA